MGVIAGAGLASEEVEMAEDQHDNSVEAARLAMMRGLADAGWKVDAFGYSGIVGVHARTGFTMETIGGGLKVHNEAARRSVEIRTWFEHADAEGIQRRTGIDGKAN